MEKGIHKPVGTNELKYASFQNGASDPNVNVIDKLYVIGHELFFKYDLILPSLNLSAASLASLIWTRDPGSSTISPAIDPNDNLDLGDGTLKCIGFKDDYVLTPIPLGEVGQGLLDPTFYATSIIGALNQVKSEINSSILPLNTLNQVSRYLDVSSVVGSGLGTITVTTNTDHLLTSGDVVIMSGWIGGTGNWNGAYAVTVTGLTTFEYSDTGDGSPTGGEIRTVVYTDYTITTAIPAKYKCEDIVIENLSSSDITIDIGTSFGGSDEQQLVSFTATPTSGTWDVTFLGDTATLNFDDDNIEIRTAMEALSSVGAGNITVSGDYTSGFTFTFVGSLSKQPFALMTIDDSSLVGATTSISETTLGVPNYVIATGVVCPANNISHVSVNEVYSNLIDVSLIITSSGWGSAYIDLHIGNKRSIV